MKSVRKANEKDIPLIRELTYKIWPQTYSKLLSEQQIEYMLTLMYSEDSLSQQMKDNSEFLIVSDENEPVGFAAIKKTNETVFKLDKIYILQSQQGKGTGKFLLNYIINEIKEVGANSLWLQVKRDNPARGFYEKNGFTITREADFDIGNGYYMQDYIMEINL